MNVAIGMVVLLGASAPNVGVIVVGDDAAQLQSELETRMLAVPNVRTVSADVFAPKLGKKAARPPLDADALREMSSRLDAAGRAYYAGELDVLDEQLGEVARIAQPLEWIPVKQRVRWLSWRATAALARDDMESARGQVRAALALRSDYVPDLRELPPSLKRLVVAQREAMGTKRFGVRFDVPAGARVVVDDREVHDGHVELPAGTHYVFVAAAGRETAVRAIEVARDTVVHVPLAVALSPETQDGLARLAAGESDALPPEVQAMCERSGIDRCLVIVKGPDNARAVCVSPEGIERGSGAADNERRRARLVRWASMNLGVPLAAAEVDHGPRWITEVSGAPAFALRSRNPDELATIRFSGTGPAVAVDLRYGRFVSSVDSYWIYYGFHTAHTVLRDQSLATAGGGHTTGVRALAGYAQPVGRVELQALAGGTWQTHRAQAFFELDGDRAGILNDYTRASVDTRLIASTDWQVGTIRVRVSAEAGASPLASWNEHPNTLGREVAGVQAVGYGADVELRGSRPWSVHLRYAGERTQVRFSGQSAIQLADPLNDALLVEQQHLLMVRGEWRIGK